MVTHLKRLSEISAVMPSSPLDQVVGVIGGTTDTLFSISQIGTIPLTADLNVYLSASGSDSNPGTITQPFATMFHALGNAANYDYAEQFNYTINVADGTYPEDLGGSAWVIPIVRSPASTGLAILGNFANPQNVVFSNAAGFNHQGQYTSFIFGFTLQMKYVGSYCFSITDANGNLAGGHAAEIDQGGPIIADFTNVGSGNFSSYIACAGGGTYDSNNGATTTFVGPGMGIMMTAQSGGNVQGFDGQTITFPATSFAMFEQAQFNPGAGQIIYIGNTIVNGGSITGGGVFGQAPSFGSARTNTGSSTDFINQTTLQQDFSIGWEAVGSGSGRGWSIIASTEVPTTSEICPGAWAVWKDTSGGGLYVAANDGGTIKKVALV